MIRLTMGGSVTVRNQHQCKVIVRSSGMEGHYGMGRKERGPFAGDGKSGISSYEESQRLV